MPQGALLALAALLAVGLAAAPAHAQQADFVLFGAGEPAETPDAHEYVHPVTAPYVHENSFVTTDVRAWYVYHEFPSGGVINGGEAHVAAAQVRLALTRQLQLVAYKDGYVWLDSGLVEADGLNDLAAGLKWKFFEDWDAQLHAAAGVGYEIKAGHGDVLQNDDEIRVWGSADKGFGALHLGAMVNGFFAVGDEDALGDSDRLSWHLHADYHINDWLSPVLEFNGYHTLDEGKAVLPIQGVDITNLGGGADEDVVTIGVGAEVRPFEDAAVRVGYETPLTNGRDLFDHRLTTSLVWSF